MKEVFQTAMIWLPIFWTALTFLCLRGYCQDCKRPPLTETEKAEMAKLEASFPRKQFRGLRWYLTHPKQGFMSLMAALALLPVIFLFLPMAILIWILPPPHRR